MREWCQEPFLGARSSVLCFSDNTMVPDTISPPFPGTCGPVSCFPDNKMVPDTISPSTGLLGTKPPPPSARQG
jgi:hypothetical protein